MRLGTAASSRYDQELGGVLRDYIAGLVSSVDSGNVAMRTRYHLMAAPAAEVGSISDEAICRQAAVAFEQSIASGTGVAFDPAGVGPVYVVRTPDRYV
ncbi:MAG TPA: hypothetical protein VFJ74_08815, partial [Gemmatimonadaceae bacterium]|nr:hypothetical protein [Gemmatimonadaceae bacterium]